MILKCIGGQLNGERHRVPFDRVGDCVKIQEPVRVFATFDLDELSPQVINYHVYVIDCFHFSKNERYLFLRPDDWTNKRAMMHQFNK